MADLGEHPVACTVCGSLACTYKKRTFLGFHRYDCEECGEEVLLPLSGGYRTMYWVVLVLMGLMQVAAFAQGTFVLPGLLGVCSVVALVKDKQLSREAREGPPRD